MVNSFWRYLGLLSLLLASTANAADLFCGVDTDRSGAVDNACPEPDKDHDGYPSSASYTGPYGTDVDCDDTDFFMYPGAETTTGCSAGQYKTCQSNGSYSACSNVSAFTCHSGTGSTYWVDAAGVTTAGCGAHDSPCNWFCFSNSALSCYHAPAAGDCVVFKDDGGAYSGTWSDAGTDRQFYFYNKDGTSTDKITIRNEPGVRPVINGAGTSPTEVYPIRIEESNYVIVRGFEVDGTSDYSNTAISFAGGTAPIAHNNYIHDIRGSANQNMGCLKAQGNTAGVSFHHNFCRDVYDAADATNQNSGGVTIMDDTGNFSVSDNVVYSSTRYHFGIRVKHHYTGATATIKRNLVYNTSGYALGTEQASTTFANNWLNDCTGFGIDYKAIGSASCQFSSNVYEYNTFQGCPPAEIKPSTGDCPGAYGATIATTRYNVVSDDDASYAGDYTDGFIRVNFYGSDTDYTNASGKIIFNDNCYYNSAAATLAFTYWGDVGSGASGANYSGLAAWQAAGFDSGSYNENPTLDSDGIASSTNCSNKGWNKNLFTSVAASPAGGYMPYFE